MALQTDFPFVLDGTRGYFKFSESDRTIFGRIRQLLLTNPGERPFLCGFGIGLNRYLFEPMDDIMVNMLSSKILEQITRYEPYLAIKSLAFLVVDYGPPAKLLIHMLVENRKTNNSQLLSFPVGDNT